FVGDNAAAGHNHRAVLLADHALEHAALDAPVGRNAVERDNFVERQSGIAAHLAIELDERKLELLREHRAEGRLAGATPSNEREAPAAQRLLVTEIAHQ